MRTPISSLSMEEIALLPRVTRWRAIKRGWIALDYHKGGEKWTPRERDDAALEAHFSYEQLYHMAEMTWWHCWSKGMAMPRWFSKDDFIQEAVIAVWRLSSKFREEIKDPVGFVMHVMRIEGPRSIRRKWDRSITKEMLLIEAPSKREDDLAWVEAMLEYASPLLGKRDAAILERHIFESRRLTERVLHKLHRIFGAMSKCETCASQSAQSHSRSAKPGQSEEL